MSKAPHLIVIDDDEPFRNGLKNLIRALGYSVDTFGSARAFLESNSVRSASCLIVDVQMPGMSGIELQKHLSVAGDRTPMIFVTALPNEGTRSQVIADGAIDCLAKPLCEQSFLACLNKSLDRNH